MAEIICPRCGAKGNESCTTLRGNDHRARILAEIATREPDESETRHVHNWADYTDSHTMTRVSTCTTCGLDRAPEPDESETRHVHNWADYTDSHTMTRVSTCTTCGLDRAPEPDNREEDR